MMIFSGFDDRSAFAGLQAFRACHFLDFRFLDFDFSMYIRFERTIKDCKRRPFMHGKALSK